MPKHAADIERFISGGNFIVVHHSSYAQQTGYLRYVLRRMTGKTSAVCAERLNRFEFEKKPPKMHGGFMLIQTIFTLRQTPLSYKPLVHHPSFRARRSIFAF